jgi:hypothetical protein
MYKSLRKISLSWQVDELKKEAEELTEKHPEVYPYLSLISYSVVPHSVLEE